MGEIIRQYTFRLFGRPTFAEGAGRIFDFSNSLEQYNYSKDDDSADREAIFSDWLAVGQDMRQSLQKYGQERQPNSA